MVFYQFYKKDETRVVVDTIQRAVFKRANFEEKLIYNRVVEAVIWAMPAVNSELLQSDYLLVWINYLKSYI